MNILRKLKKIITSRPLTIDLLTAMATLLIITVCIITWYSYIQGRRAVYQMMDMLANSAVNIVIERTVHFLEPAAMMAQMTGRITDTGTVDFSNQLYLKRMSNYMTEVLHVYPQLSMFYYGTEDGNYFMNRKMPDGSISTQIINRTSAQPGTTTITRDIKGNIIQEENTQNIDFDPRTRPWYIGAKKTKQNFWTDVYIFFTNQKPGISASFPDLDQNGTVRGVVGVDISLDSLSEFLEKLAINKQGTAFIVNRKHELIASSDETVVEQLKDSYHLKKISEIDDPVLRTIYAHYQQTGEHNFAVYYDDHRYAGVLTQFPFVFKKWSIGIFIKSNYFIDILDDANTIVAIISLIILIIALLVSVLMARSISRPIMYLADATGRIKDMYLDEPVDLKSHIRELQTMHRAINGMKTGLQAFNKYVPSELVRELLDSGQEVSLGGDRRVLSILFTDIEGFTTISETLPPETVMLHISTYFSELIDILIANKATVDKFIGDSIMAFWGAPKPDELHAYHACYAALLCIEKLRILNEQWQLDGKPPMVTRFGIHTGETVVGNVGSEQRMNYTVLGDSVNIASRLEQLNKNYDTSILVSQPVFEATHDSFLFRPLGNVTVKGRSSKIQVYELLDRIDSNNELIKNLCSDFKEAINIFEDQDYKNARTLFDAIQRKYPDDKPTQIFIDQCDIMINPQKK